jgi:hypothetical protein
MTTATDELRAASARLRELAAAASTDRYGRDTSTWTSHHVNERDARLFGPDRVRIIRGGSSGPHGRGVQPHLAPAHADYIAAMDPTAGLALVLLLEAVTSNALENDHEECRSYCTPETCDVAAALALAQAINGSQS